MTPRVACLHGHSLNAPEQSSGVSDLVCSLCGADIRHISDTETDPAGALAVTVVPTSEPRIERDPLLAGAPMMDAGRTGQSDSSADSFAPTTDYVVSDLKDAADSNGTVASVSAEQQSAAPRTEPAETLPNESRKDQLKPPALAGLEVFEELGRGGMGVVYRAYDEKHSREVALKTLQRMGPDDLVRFKQEFRALADIAHPNLASLYELHSDGTTWCLTMELLRGVEFLEFVWSEFDALKVETARRRVADMAAESRLTMRRINRLYDALKQLAIGLNTLHGAGKLHSDIKPSNVLMTTESRLVLLDFGLIAEITRDDDGRIPQVIQGTPHYMAPEQVACSALTAASDWYAVGVMLYEVLTGRLPFQDKSVKAMLRKQIEMPLAPGKRKQGVPKELNDLCMALLEIDPANRPSTTDVLRAVEAEDIADSIEADATRIVPDSFELVGREPHFEVLTESFDAVLGGETRSVFVHGLSGMGKSALIHGFLDQIQARHRIILLQGRCYEQESVPFKALDSLVDALVLYLSDVPADRLKLLLPADTLPLVRLFPVFGQIHGADDSARPTIDSADQHELRQRASTSLRTLLISLGEAAPLVLYIDDMQWGDEDSAQLLADLVRPPAGPRLLLVGSYRREDIERSPALLALTDAFKKGTDPPHRCELPVEELSEHDAGRLAVRLLGGDSAGSQHVCERIARESNGSPFFVWELAHHVREDPTASVGNLTLDEVIWSRVCRLPEDTQALLEVFAVAGRPMRASEAFAVIDARTHGPGLLAQLKTGNFIRTTDREDDTIVETYHDRIRESVSSHLPVVRVRERHLKLALVIEQSGDVSLARLQSHLAATPDFQEPGDPLSLDVGLWQRVFDLAYFFDAADKPDRALPYALAAAEQAWSQNALDVAEQQFEIARRGAASATDALRFRIAEGLGDVLLMRGRYEDALAQFNAARALATDSVTLARIDSKLGFVCFKSGDMHASSRHLEKALAELGAPPPRNLVIQSAAVGKELFVQLLHTWLPSRLTQRRDATTDSGQRQLFLARVYDLLSYPYWWIKGPVPNLWTHLRHMNLAERYPASQVLGRAWSFHAIVMMAIPLPGRGVRYADRSYAIHKSEGDLQGQGKARSYKTFAHFTAGRFRDAVSSGSEAVTLLEEAGDVWEANMARIILSFAQFYLGDLPAAADSAATAVRIGQETGDTSSIRIALWFWMLAAPADVPEGQITQFMTADVADPLSDAAIIQGRGLELLRREDKPEEAAKVLQDSLDAARKRGLRNPCVFCGATWKAEALRIVAERAPKGAARNAAIRRARKAVRQALLITRLYLTSRTHALREAALIDALDGRESRARQRIDESIRLASEQEAAYELARSELARGRIGAQFRWPDAQKQIESAAQAIDRLTGTAMQSDDE